MYSLLVTSYITRLLLSSVQCIQDNHHYHTSPQKYLETVRLKWPKLALHACKNYKKIHEIGLEELRVLSMYCYLHQLSSIPTAKAVAAYTQRSWSSATMVISNFRYYEV